MAVGTERLPGGRVENDRRVRALHDNGEASVTQAALGVHHHVWPPPVTSRPEHRHCPQEPRRNDRDRDVVEASCRYKRIAHRSVPRIVHELDTLPVVSADLASWEMPVCYTSDSLPPAPPIRRLPYLPLQAAVLTRLSSTSRLWTRGSRDATMEAATGPNGDHRRVCRQRPVPPARPWAARSSEHPAQTRTDARRERLHAEAMGGSASRLHAADQEWESIMSSYSGPIVDVDVHHTWGSSRDLMEYLPRRWHEYSLASSAGGPLNLLPNMDNINMVGNYIRGHARAQRTRTQHGRMTARRRAGPGTSRSWSAPGSVGSVRPSEVFSTSFTRSSCVRIAPGQMPPWR